MSHRWFTTACRRSQHENPLGLPQKGTPPAFASRLSRNLPTRRRIPSVRKVIAITSAKGGVGKSTIAANLALALARQNHRTGILDTDIFGPSIPTLFNLLDQPAPELTRENRLVPLTNYGVASMSMGYLLGPGRGDTPTAWRGAMVQKAMQQLLLEVDWGAATGGRGLDVLVLDLPPGTGDVQLTVGQTVEVDGAVVVTTPQVLARADAVRGVGLLKKMETQVLGTVVNMAGFRCPGCGEVTGIFDDGADGGEGESAARREAERLGLRTLAEVPLERGICRDADRGKPTVVADPDGHSAKVFGALAKEVARLVGL